MLVINTDMKLPKYGYECPCCDRETGRCRINYIICDERPHDCPLFEFEGVKCGHWEKDEAGIVKCSNCGAVWAGKYSFFCAKCGCKMG